MKKTILFLAVLPFVSLAQIPKTLSSEDKVYGLSKFWSEVNYNFIYLDKVDRANWDSTYKSLITAVQKTENDYQYYRLLQKFCALLKDGHTNVYFPETKGYETMTTMFGDYRLFLTNIDGKAIVVRTNLSKKQEIPIGSEIIEVNGKPTQQYIKDNVSPYISSSTDYVLQDWSIARLLTGFEGDKYNLKIKKPNGDVISVALTHAQTKEKEVFPEFEKNVDLLEFKWYPNQIAYVGLHSFGDERIDSLFIAKLPELYKAKGLIIDLRYNGGGSTNIGVEILEYLTNDTILYGSKNTTRLHMPSYKAWGKYRTPTDTTNNEFAKKALLSYQDKYYYEFEYEADTVKLKAKRIVVPTTILMGHSTASAAEDFLIYADKQRHMTKIGENSCGSTGQPFSFDLPGGGSARICTKKDTYPDGREFVGVGVKPDIVVRETVNDYLQKKDPVLAKALEYLKTKIK